MSFDPQDPKWTAYVLGELDDDARSEIDRELAQSTEAQRFVDELRRTIDLVSAELQAEPCPTMADVEAAPAETGLAEPALAESESFELEPGEQFDEWSDVRTELAYAVRPAGHQRGMGRAAVLALAASLLAIVSIGSYLVSPSSWHLRDFKIVWKGTEKPTEAVSESASEEDVVLDHSSPDLPLAVPGVDQGFIEVPTDDPPEVKLELRDGRVIQGAPGPSSTTSSATPASGMGRGMGGGFFGGQVREPEGGTRRALTSRHGGAVADADPGQSAGEGEKADFETQQMRAPEEGRRRITEALDRDRRRDSAGASGSGTQDGKGNESKSRVSGKLAGEYEKLMDEHRFAEAEVLAKRAIEADPADPLARQMFWNSKFLQRAQPEHGENSKERGVVDAFTDVDRASIPAGPYPSSVVPRREGLGRIVAAPP